jgi:uncharacterized membrane protein
MNEDQIVARAQRDVAERRKAAMERRWGGPWRWLLPMIVLAVLVVFLAAPAPLPRKLLLAMGGVCGLRPAHSYFVGGVHLPLEARMIGIYGGFLLTFVALVAFRRLGTRRLGSPLVISILAICLMSMAFDGVNSTFAELGLPHLYPPTNLLRLLTGLLSGIAIAPFLLWLLSVVATPREPGVSQAVVRSPWELIAALAVNAGFAALVLDGRATFYYPIALVSVLGIVGVLAMTVLLVILAISDLAGRVTHVRQLVAPGALALLIAFTVLGATATARWTFIVSLAGQ